MQETTDFVYKTILCFYKKIHNIAKLDNVFLYENKNISAKFVLGFKFPESRNYDSIELHPLWKNYLWKCLIWCKNKCIRYYYVPRARCCIWAKTHSPEDEVFLSAGKTCPLEDEFCEKCKWLFKWVSLVFLLLHINPMPCIHRSTIFAFEHWFLWHPPCSQT